MALYRLIACLLLLAPSFAQQKQATSPTNGWSLGWNPYNVFDTLTGTEIQPTDVRKDSAQAFKMYGNPIRFQGQWIIGFPWDKDFPQTPIPQKILVDAQIKGIVSVQHITLGIGITDTSKRGTRVLAADIDIKPGWQDIEIPVGKTRLEYIHKIKLIFQLSSSDPSYCGIELVLNNLRGIRAMDTVLIDPFQYGTTTEIEPPRIPMGYRLYQNYPNPFNPTTRIRYEVKESDHIHLDIYDILGKHIQSLVDEFQTPGTYEVLFSPKNLASGTYIYALRAGKKAIRKKMMLMK